jgi:hypothetical protein
MTTAAQRPEAQQDATRLASRSSLTAALAGVRALLERAAGRELDGAASEETTPGALEELTTTFGLSGFEQKVLVMCAGVELDSSIPALCAEAQGDAARQYPTFGLALAAFPDAHWSAVSPNSPLRYWRLIEFAAGSGITASALRISEWALSFLAGVPHLDEQLASFVVPVAQPALIAASHEACADKIVRHLLACQSRRQLPLVQLCGGDGPAKLSIVSLVGRQVGWKIYRLPADCVPTSPADLDNFRRLWERETALTQSVLLVDCEGTEPGDGIRFDAARRFLDTYRGPLFVACRQRLSVRERPVFSVDVEKPEPTEQKDLWLSCLGERSGEASDVLDIVVGQFHLGAHLIRSVSDEALAGDENDLAQDLWNICRRQSRPKLDELAQRITSNAGWPDLVLPDSPLQALREICAQARNRGTVHEEWGFRGKDARGLGVSALFAGPSGTGKTLASEVLANDLLLDLYRVDLSQVVSKYIGETEKNLRRVFDAAEEGGVVLLFDEADAIFGKRSEVKDSHDRYANIEVSYLLQRMECYNGLAILTTNLKSAVDPAFLRRLRFIVQFPFPDQEQRKEIWKRVFPSRTPVEPLQYDKLAKLNMAGGNIRNIALSAAFLAADAGGPVNMTHLARAARAECAKLERPISETEIGLWI